MKELIESIYNQYRHIIPERLLYSPIYFQTARILRTGSHEQKSALAAARLRRTMLIAKINVPFYKDIALTISEIQNENPLVVLRHFPFIEKDQIMDEPARFINGRCNLAFAKYATSGGSTGKGIGIWRSKVSSDIERLFFHTRWGAVGYAGDQSKVLRIGADARRRIHENPVWRLGQKVMLSPYHVNKNNVNSIARTLASTSFNFIHAYPSIFLEFTRLLTEIHSASPFNVEAIFLASEPCTIDQLRLIESYWGCKIVVHYGLAERTNLAFYYYNSTDDNISYRLEPLYSVSENFPGSTEIVGTSLWNDAMPLIRYRTKDHGAILDGVIHTLTGRDQDFLVDRHGDLIPGTSIVIDEITWSQVRQYQVKQRQPGKIELLVVPRGEAIEEAFQQYILQQQINRWGDFFDISMTVCGDIPLTAAGKSKLVDVSLH